MTFTGRARGLIFVQSDLHSARVTSDAPEFSATYPLAGEPGIATGRPPPTPFTVRRWHVFSVPKPLNTCKIFKKVTRPAMKEGCQNLWKRVKNDWEMATEQLYALRHQTSLGSDLGGLQLSTIGGLIQFCLLTPLIWHWFPKGSNMLRRRRQPIAV